MVFRVCTVMRMSLLYDELPDNVRCEIHCHDDEFSHELIGFAPLRLRF